MFYYILIIVRAYDVQIQKKKCSWNFCLQKSQIYYQDIQLPIQIEGHHFKHTVEVSKFYLTESLLEKYFMLQLTKDKLEVLYFVWKTLLNEVHCCGTRNTPIIENPLLILNEHQGTVLKSLMLRDSWFYHKFTRKWYLKIPLDA